MIARFALPETDDHQLKDDVCAWLESNHINPDVVPLRSEVTIRDAEIGYWVQSRDAGITWTYWTTELMIPMPVDLADRWRRPPNVCDCCGTDINTMAGLP